MVRVVSSKALYAYVKRLKLAGCRISRNQSAAIVEAYEDSLPVLRAMRKGRCAEWLCIFTDGVNVYWRQPSVDSARPV